MGKQLSIYLDEVELLRLTELATRECRRPNDQARYLLRTALLDATPSTDGNAQRVTVASPPCAAEPIYSP